MQIKQGKVLKRKLNNGGGGGVSSVCRCCNQGKEVKQDILGNSKAHQNQALYCKQN